MLSVSDGFTSQTEHDVSLLGEDETTQQAPTRDKIDSSFSAGGDCEPSASPCGSDVRDTFLELRNFRSKHPKNMIISHYNINSIRNKFYEMKIILELQLCDILGVAETKLDKSFPMKQFCIDNYKLYRQDRNSRGGGVMLYIKDTIPNRIIKEFSGERNSIDYITIELTTQRGKWNLTYIYCPPRVPDSVLSEFMFSLSEYFVSRNTLCLFFGDLNQNFMNENALTCVCDVHGLSNIIAEPTCFKAQNPTLLDVFLTDKRRSFVDHLNCDIGLSDFHNYTCVASKLFAPCEPLCKIKYRTMRHFDAESFNNDLSCAPFHVCDLFDDIDDIVWGYKRLYESVLDVHAPLKTRTISYKQVPHMNSDLRKARNQRNMWRAKHFRNRNDIFFRSRYVYWRNKVVSLNRLSIKKYFEEKCKDSKCSRSFFKTISPYISDSKMRNGQRIILRENDNVISEPLDVANIFNVYYKSIAEYNEICDSLSGLSLENVISKHASHPSILSIENHNTLSHTFEFSCVSENKMKIYIDSLNSTKAPGYDKLKSKLIKLSSVSISAPLTRIFNACVSKSHFPFDMKLSEISPIFKKDDSLSKENYRSVNILTVLSKVFERIIADQLTDYFKSILNSRISAYRKGYSCQQVILNLTEFWRSALDRNEFVGTISTDLSKAFDRMPHGLLMSKLHAYGVSPNACRLIMSYLSDRMQRVKILGSVSDWSIINRGVPQGSVLGPLLFNIFINDLFYKNISACIANYADDNNLCNAQSSIEDLKISLAKDTALTMKWYNDNELEANPDKFQCVVMNRNGPIETSIHVHDKLIYSSKNIKVLGVLLDSKLDFKPYITNICARASRQLNAFRRVSKFLDIPGRLKVYNAFISANFTYCPVTWIFCGKVNSGKLEKIQEKALRVVYNDHKSSYSELLAKSDLVSLSIYRLRFLAIEMFKCVHGHNPKYLNDLFTKKPKKYDLRDSDLLVQPKFKTLRFGYRSFSYYGAKLWNSLPKNMKQAENVQIFKSHLYGWCRSENAKFLEIF